MSKDLHTYFEQTRGLGVLSTADASGRVDAALYARPHVVDQDTVAFIMGEKTTYRNLRENPNAAFLFKEDGEGYQGKRIFLEKIREERESDQLDAIRRRKKYEPKDGAEYSVKYVVFFRVTNIVPLVGAGECPVLDADARG